jgi:hypothetical protein
VVEKSVGMLSLAFGGCEEYDRLVWGVSVRVRDIEQNSVREEILTGIRILSGPLYYKRYSQTVSHSCEAFEKKLSGSWSGRPRIAGIFSLVLSPSRLLL